MGEADENIEGIDIFEAEKEKDLDMSEARAFDVGLEQYPMARKHVMRHSVV